MFEFGGMGAPAGMFLITGNGLRVAPLKPAARLPTLSGPVICVVFLTMLSEELGWHQSEPWNASLLPRKVIAPAVFGISETSVNIWLLPLEPCQLEPHEPDDGV